MKRPMFYWVCLFVLGELCGNVIPIKWIGLTAVLTLLASGIFYGLKKGHPMSAEAKCQSREILLAVGFVFFVLGMFCMGCAKRKAEICRLPEGREICFQGRIIQSQPKGTRTVYIVKIYRFYASSAGKEMKENLLRGGVRVMLFPEDGVEYVLGSIIEAEGKVNPFSQASNPGEYDEEKVQYGNGNYFAVKDVRVNQVERPMLPVRQWLADLSVHFSKVYERILSKNDAALAKAMVLGDKEDLDQELRERYQKNGIAHLIAISGLHIAMIGGGLYRIMRKLLGGYLAPAAIGITFILGYGVMTGLSGATFRAVLMIIISIGAELSGRRYDMLTAMAAALLVMLIENPFRLWQAGFLLSFGAVFGIAVIQPMWKIYIPALPHWLEGFCVSVSVQIVILPVLLYYFFEVPVYGVLLNLIVVPLMGLLLPLLLFGGLAGTFFLQTAGVVMIPVRGIFRLYEAVCHISENMPGHTFSAGRPSFWWLAAYYGGILFIVSAAYRRKHMHKGSCNKKDNHGEDGQGRKEPAPGRKKKKTAIAFCAVCLFYGILFISLCMPGKLIITMLDVGQGDGIYIRTPGGKHILMDGGSSSKNKVGTYILSSALKYYGGNRLDYVFVSHSDSDHYSGIVELLEKGEPFIENLILPDIANPDEAYLELVQQAIEKRCRVFYMKNGDVLKEDGVSFLCLHPECADYADKNTGSLVINLSYGSFDMLFTGDLDAQGEREVQEKLPERQIEILKVGHHGSATSTSLDFLDRLRPRAACISVGEENRYGHPAPEVMRRLSGFADKIYLTKDDGAITIETDGKTYRFSTFKQFSD